ncbi:hypothetical protein NEOKW01_0934 [Nematocida sp. AWRm80]|nr:hypothetical protein NEOKW01_0934 [Nematocida sp. AWRm80]
MDTRAIEYILRNKHSPWKIFNLDASCSQKDIKKKYIELSLLVHPDKNTHPLAKEAFIILRNSYTQLISYHSIHSNYSTHPSTNSDTLSNSDVTTILTEPNINIECTMNDYSCIYDYTSTITIINYIIYYFTALFNVLALIGSMVVIIGIVVGVIGIICAVFKA